MVTFMHTLIFLASMAYVWYARMVAMRTGVPGSAAYGNPSDEDKAWMRWHGRFGVVMCFVCLVVMGVEFVLPLPNWVMILANFALLAHAIWMISKLSFGQSLDD